jgi:hypothetical protein
LCKLFTSTYLFVFSKGKLIVVVMNYIDLTFQNQSRMLKRLLRSISKTLKLTTDWPKLKDVWESMTKLKKLGRQQFKFLPMIKICGRNIKGC